MKKKKKKKKKSKKRKIQIFAEEHNSANIVWIVTSK